MISIAGGKNIFTDGKGYINLYEVYGEEAFAEIVKRDPQVIMSPYWPGAFDYEVTTIYEIMTRPGFDQTEAVKTGRVCYYDSSLMKRFGPRTITAIEKLAYPLPPSDEGGGKTEGFGGGRDAKNCFAFSKVVRKLSTFFSPSVAYGTSSLVRGS